MFVALTESCAAKTADQDGQERATELRSLRAAASTREAVLRSRRSMERARLCGESVD